jgi:AcrR family transcriptional regulator
VSRVPRHSAPVGVAVRRSQPRQQVAEVQRSRLLVGAVSAIDEHGYSHTTVGHIALHAGVSRRTFYELFADREACLAALFEDVVGMIEGELAAAALAGLPWRERVRGGLWAILSFFDREPALARVCVVQVLRGGPGVLERRDVVLSRLAAVLDEGREASARQCVQCTELTAEGLVGAAFGIVYARLLHGERTPLAGLFGELMGMIVLPYLGPAAARREQARPVPGPVASVERALVGPRDERDPLAGTGMRLTYRTARVLRCIDGEPGASNRVVAEHAGVADPGQISKLLRRLERLGLVVNTGGGHLSGEPNAWELTARGLQVAGRLSIDAGRRVEAA